MKDCTAAGAAPLLAVIVMTKGAPVTPAGVPFSTPELVFRLAQVGSPVALKIGAGVPVAVTVKVTGNPTVKMAALPLVICGGMVTVRVTGAEVALLRTLVAVQRNWSPLIARVTPVIVNVAVVVLE